MGSLPVTPAESFNFRETPERTSLILDLLVELNVDPEIIEPMIGMVDIFSKHLPPVERKILVNTNILDNTHTVTLSWLIETGEEAQVVYTKTLTQEGADLHFQIVRPKEVSER